MKNINNAFKFFIFLSVPSLFAQEVLEHGTIEFKPLVSSEMRKQICSQLENPFSKENINVISSELKEVMPKTDWAYKVLFNVNRKLASDVKKRCDDSGEITLFDNHFCKTTCKEEFNKEMPSKIQGWLTSKSDRLNLCLKSCDAVSIAYNASVRSLTPIYRKLDALKHSSPKCYNQAAIIDSRQEKQFESISDYLTPTSNNGNAVPK